MNVRQQTPTSNLFYIPSGMCPLTFCREDLCNVYSMKKHVIQHDLEELIPQRKRMDKATGHKNIRDYVNIQLGGVQSPCIHISIPLSYLIILARFVCFIRKK